MTRAEVLEGGEIRAGDEVAWEEERQMGLPVG
jgi:MOSC domain-containing protein YiiM